MRTPRNKPPFSNGATSCAPEKLPQIAAMIYQGAPYDQVARAAAQLTRVAQPEIAAVSTMTGTADLPPGVLDNILANVDNGVDYTLKRRELAGRVLGYGAPLNYPDFQQQDTSLLNDYQANADQRRQGYGAIGTGGAANNNPPPPVASQPTATWPDAITSLVHWLSSGGAQPSQPSPSPPPPDDASPSPSLSPPPGSSIWDTVSHFFGGGAQPQPAPSIELKPDANGAYPSTGGREMPQHVTLSNGYKLDIPDGLTNDQISDRVNHMEALVNPQWKGWSDPFQSGRDRTQVTDPAGRIAAAGLNLNPVVGGADLTVSGLNALKAVASRYAPSLRNTPDIPTVSGLAGSAAGVAHIIPQRLPGAALRRSRRDRAGQSEAGDSHRPRNGRRDRRRRRRQLDRQLLRRPRLEPDRALVRQSRRSGRRRGS